MSWRHDVRFVDGLFLDEVERHVRGFAGHAYWILANRGQADVVGVEAVVIADKRYIARHGETVALQLEHERQSNAVFLAGDGSGQLRQTHQLGDHIADLVTAGIIHLADDDLRFDALVAAAFREGAESVLHGEVERHIAVGADICNIAVAKVDQMASR